MSKFPAVYPGETTSRTSRTTKEGRDLTYVLRVIQQPERARACGSGAKASADRRPVDPPPVVELRIFEGCYAKDAEIDLSKDITFSYNANFFLFATLEHFRPMAHGRVPGGANAPPVLTGMPVSGMAYLDRPAEAGYFIFPDLSVRHEGKYVLSFNLYEETKEAKDEDPENFDPKQPHAAASAGMSSSFDWRMEVKSKDFTVFSAKKFPGLAESTTLSRTVAEQGCRVRIRRDVRMRRREGKSSDGGFDDEERSFSRRSVTPSHNPYDRPRSLSNSSTGRVPFEPHRRPSDADYQAPYASSTYASSPATPQAQPKTYLDFGAGAGHQQYAAPQYAHPQQPPQTAAPYPPPPSFRQPPAPSSYSYERPSYPAYHAGNGAKRDFEPDYRRTVAQPANSASSQYPTLDPAYSRPAPSYQPPTYSRPQTPAQTLAPLKNLLEPKPEAIPSLPAPPVAHAARATPALPHPSFAVDRANYPSLPPPEHNRNGKRPFESVFQQSAQTLQNGMRPSNVNYTQSPKSDEDDFPPTEMLTYKRADGRDQTRNFPV